MSERFWGAVVAVLFLPWLVVAFLPYWRAWPFIVGGLIVTVIAAIAIDRRYGLRELSDRADAWIQRVLR